MGQSSTLALAPASVPSIPIVSGATTSKTPVIIEATTCISVGAVVAIMWNNVSIPIEFSNEIHLDSEISEKYESSRTKFELFMYYKAKGVGQRCHGGLVFIPDDKSLPCFRVHLCAKGHSWNVSVDKVDHWVAKRFTSRGDKLSEWSLKNIVDVTMEFAQNYGNYSKFGNNCLRFRRQLFHKICELDRHSFHKSGIESCVKPRAYNVNNKLVN